MSGDPLNGQLLYTSDTLACYGCHVGQAGKTAPALDGTFTRAEETRLADPTLTDYNIEQYLIESIVQPGHYTVPGYANVMPADFGARLTLQDLADLLLFLESQDGPSPE
ncbi:MAG TPA: c-type cytochrome [Phototrophicaceae bacterium]|nr:c-type cytochrome [Phototrophicaceae bacterium]